MLVNPDDVQGYGSSRTNHIVPQTFEKKINFCWISEYSSLGVSHWSFGNVLHLWLSTSTCCFEIVRVSGSVALRSAETVLSLFLTWSYPFSLLSLLYPENVEVRRVPFQGLRGLMHWDTNVLKRPRRWQWTTITPRAERKQVWTMFSPFSLIKQWYF